MVQGKKAPSAITAKGSGREDRQDTISDASNWAIIDAR
jgi:hypothetical protein